MCLVPYVWMVVLGIELVDYAWILATRCTVFVVMAAP